MGMGLVLGLAFVVGLAWAGDINRQSIVFHEETPEVFYCPQEKPISLEGMIVKAKPLSKLCEHEGKALPDDYISDCWNDVDETDYACKEKKRILLKLKPPGSENAIVDNFIPIFRPGEYKKVTDLEERLEMKRKKAEKEEKERLAKLRRPKHDF